MVNDLDDLLFFFVNDPGIFKLYSYDSWVRICQELPQPLSIKLSTSRMISKFPAFLLVASNVVWFGNTDLPQRYWNYHYQCKFVYIYIYYVYANFVCTTNKK